MRKELLQRLRAVTEEERELLSGGGIRAEKYFAEDGAVVAASRVLPTGKTFSVRQHTRFAAFPEHRHNYLEIMIVLSGHLTHRIADEAITLGAGDILFLNRHLRHAIECAGEDDIGVNCILSEVFLSGLPEVGLSPEISSLLAENRKSAGEGQYLLFRTDGIPEIDNLVENILFEVTGEENAEVLSGTVALLFTTLSAKCEGKRKSGNITTPSRDARAAVIRSYVDKNYKTATLEELAAKTYLSVPYLCRLIPRLFGKTFRELLFDKRYEAAFALLCDTDLPISEIAHAVGYENPSWFHKAFRARSGATPLAVRRANKKT